MELHSKVQALRHMDNVIRMISDEETGIFEDWIALHVPDEASDEELASLIQEMPEFYPEACEFFARNIAILIDFGDWNKQGYSLEFFNREAYDKGGIYNEEG